MNDADFVSRLGAKAKPKQTSTGWQCRCPAHDDGKASLCITQADDKVLIHCQAGCTPQAVCEAAGVKIKDLFTDKPKPQRNGFNIVATYDYTDENGNLLLQAERLDPKDFRQRRPDATTPDGWTWKTADVRRVLYRLPKIIQDVQRGLPIIICEGEKDVAALVQLGFSATCNLGGAGKWRPEYSETLRGASVWIVADKDKPGREHAQAIAASLYGKASFVAVLELPDSDRQKVKDAADFIAAGATVADFQAELDDAQEWTPQAAPLVAKSDSEQAADTTADANHFKNDVGYADAFVKRHSESIRFCTDEAKWLVYSVEHGWRRDKSGEINSLAADYARSLYRDALAMAATLDPDMGKKLITSAASLGNKKRISPAISFAESNRDIVVNAEELDADKLLVGVRNGVVNLADGSFQPHSRDHLVTRRLDVAFDATATAPTFERFLAEVQPESDMRGFLQRLSGYWITGETREHILPFHYGTGANGKGTFLEQVMLKQFGNYGAKLTDSLVYASDRGALPHLELANLCGKRFTLGEENAKGGNLNERLLKAITGSDKVKGRFHYANFVEYFPTYKITLVGNHKPRIDGTDEGIWRRFLLVDWKVQIPPEKRDAKLSEKLAAEMPGILNWCIAGAIEWQRTGLNPPESCRAATAAFREKSDALVEFVAECFIADPDGYCTKADAFNAYTRWATRQGINHPMSKRALGFQLINRGWAEGRASHENSHCWYGWRVSNE